MMDLNKWTQKAREALQHAQEIAVRRAQQQVEALHLLAALLEAENGLVGSLLQRIGVSLPQIQARVEQELDRLPRLTGDV